jgi:hypothetical protein
VKIKLDENLGAAGADVLVAAGFDVATVVQQRLTSAPDHDIARGRFRLSLLKRALGLVVEAAKQNDVRGRLWIAEVDRVREYQER